MATTILLSGLVLIFPAITLYSERKYRIIQWIGAVVICYASGMIAGNLPWIEVDKEIFSTLSEISVSLAIPVLLFSANITGAWKYTKPAIISFSLCALSACISASLVKQFMMGSLVDGWKISGMLIGVYTGGTPNMSAIGKALEVKDEIFILINSADIVLSGIYFVFLITIGQKALQLFLPLSNKYKGAQYKKEEDSLSALPIKGKFKNVLLSLGLSILILGLAAGLSWAVMGSLSAPLVILVLTTLGLTCSFVPYIRKMEGSYQTAHYLLLVFALSIGVLADFRQLIAASSDVFMYTAVVMLGSVLLHYLMAGVLRIDTDTVIITSTAAIFGPAFIGPVANSLHNRQVIIAGITTGMLGYAIGNYLGISLAWLLQ